MNPKITSLRVFALDIIVSSPFASLFGLLAIVSLTFVWKIFSDLAMTVAYEIVNEGSTRCAVIQVTMK